MAGANGMATAVALAGGVGDLGLEGGEQADMFEPDVALPVRPVARSTGGRPAGARNKSTEEWRQYLLGRYRSPLVGLMELYSRTPLELAEELGLETTLGAGLSSRVVADVRKAAELQVQAMIAALPYLHQRLPQAVEIKSKQLGVFNLILGDYEGEQNQGVIDGLVIQSDAIQSDAEAKALADKDNPKHDA